MLVAYEQDVPRRQALAIQYKFLPTCFSHLLDVSLQLQGEGGALDTASQELVPSVLAEVRPGRARWKGSRQGSTRNQASS